MTKSLLRTAADASWEETLRLEEFAEANCFSTSALGEEAEPFSARPGRQDDDRRRASKGRAAQMPP
jgi:2-(1,2-epoxy-1,2-dihydrophenyl)acetyl-CoA isomerase